MAWNFEHRMAEVEAVLKRLDAEENNPDRTEFHHQLNHCILLARTVTWVLQKDLRHTEGFNEWYKKKQDEMERDGLSKFVKRRNDIEKKGTRVTNGGEVKIFFTDNNHSKATVIAEEFDHTGKKLCDVYGFTEHETFFDGEGKERVTEQTKNYVVHLRKIVDEAKEKFGTSHSN